MRVVVVALLVGALFAGCLSEDQPPAPSVVREPDWATRAIFAGPDPELTLHVADHDHGNASIHVGLSSPNVKVLGHDPLHSPYYDATAGTAFCGDVAERRDRHIAVVHSFGTDVALQVLDVTNRSQPVLISELVLPYSFTYDVAVFADGAYAVIAGNPDLASDTLPGALVPFVPTVRNACGQEPAQSNVDYIPYGYAAILVDLTTPENPRVADFYEYPGGRNVHSISTAMVDGIRYVATSGLGAVPCNVPSFPGSPLPSTPCVNVPRYGNLLSHFDFLTVEETPIGARFAPYMVYTPMSQTNLDPSLLYLGNGHTDATIQKHNVTGQTLAYLADWDGGLHIVRLDGPGQITPVTTWGAAPGDDPTQMRGNVHSAVPLDGLRDGRHYTLTGQEVVGRPGGRPTGQIVLLDTTTPSQPIARARWTLPVDVMWTPAEGLLFSTHYPILVDDTLYVAMYHAGVWAVDASRDNWPDLPSIGVYIPDAAPSGQLRAASPAPEVLQVLHLGDDVLLVFDANGGATTVQFDRNDARVPRAAPWSDNPWMG